MVSLILTYLNLAGGLVALFYLFWLPAKYLLAPRKQMYLVLKITTIFYLIFVQMYQLSTHTLASDWKLKLFGVSFFVTSIYWVWMTHFESLKK